jgi:DNA polymerase delta subunit 2
VRDILKVEEDVECCVVGTLYKDMKLKPSILDEYAKDK